MSSEKKFTLPNFKKGMWMFWTITTQTAADVTVTISDETGHTYVTCHRNGKTDPISPAPCVGYQQLLGNKITVTVKSSAAINHTSPAYSSVFNSGGQNVADTFSLMVEDYNDQDYNDVWVSLAAWKNRG